MEAVQPPYPELRLEILKSAPVNSYFRCNIIPMVTLLVYYRHSFPSFHVWSKFPPKNIWNSKEDALFFFCLVNVINTSPISLTQIQLIIEPQTTWIVLQIKHPVVKTAQIIIFAYDLNYVVNPASSDDCSYYFSGKRLGLCGNSSVQWCVQRLQKPQTTWIVWRIQRPVVNAAFISAANDLDCVEIPASSGACSDYISRKRLGLCSDSSVKSCLQRLL